jgi:regulatory LuxR family protein
MANGVTEKEIASRLNLPEYTVKNHLSRILKQIDAESRGQAVQAILSCGYSLNSCEGSLCGRAKDSMQNADAEDHREHLMQQ